MTSPLNAQYFTELTAQVNLTTSCAELQSIVDAQFASILAMQAGATAQLAILTPMLSLLTAPAANPTAIVTWITSFITDFLTPQLRSAVTLGTQLTELLTAIASLTSAINSKAAQFESCSITIPT